MIHSPKISCIIPISNGEKFLRETMKSVERQIFSDIEIICVDDASVDNSIQIIKQLCRDDDRIEYYQMIRKSGAAHCRNYGLKYARGEWVVFLDSDDYFYPEMLDEAYKWTDDKDIDVVVWGYECYQVNLDEGSERIKKIDVGTFLNGEVSHDELTAEFIKKGAHAPWNKLVKRELIEREKIRFQDIPSANDVLYSTKVLLNAKKIRFLDKPLVKYFFRRKGSISRQENGSLGIGKAFAACIDYLEQMNECPIQKNEYVYSAVREIYYNLNNDQYTIETRVNLLNDIRNDSVWWNAYKKYIESFNIDSFVSGFFRRMMEGLYQIGECIYFCYSRRISDILCDRDHDRVALWGYGKLGRLFMDVIHELGYSVDYIIDRDVNKQGGMIYGTKIFSYDSIKSYVDTVIVLNRAFLDEISLEAEDKNIVYIGE